MNTFNFFESIKPDKNESLSRSLFIALAVIAVFLVSAIYGYLWGKGTVLKRRLDFLDSIRNSSEFNSEYDYALCLKEGAENVENDETILNNIKNTLSAGNTDAYHTLTVISGCVKDLAYLKRIERNGDTISFEAVADDLHDIPQIEKNLRGCKEFETVLIESERMKADEEPRQYTISCSLKAGSEMP